MTCRCKELAASCKELRAALIEAKAEVEAAIYKLSEDGFCSVKLGYRMREKWENLIKETADVEQSETADREAGESREPLEPH